MPRQPKSTKKYGLTQVQYADRLWSIIVRLPQKCALAGRDHIKCSGYLQGMHIIGRTRWDLRYVLANGMCGCQAHHTFYTWHQAEWHDILEKYWPARVELLKNIPTKGHIKINYVDTINFLESVVVTAITGWTLDPRDYRSRKDAEILSHLTEGEGYHD